MPTRAPSNKDDVRRGLGSARKGKSKSPTPGIDVRPVLFPYLKSGGGELNKKTKSQGQKRKRGRKRRKTGGTKDPGIFCFFAHGFLSAVKKISTPPALPTNPIENSETSFFYIFWLSDVCIERQERG
jgi:hypothetical protein